MLSYEENFEDGDMVKHMKLVLMVLSVKVKARILIFAKSVNDFIN